MAQNRGISTAVNAQTSENLPTCRGSEKRGILKDWALNRRAANAAAVAEPQSAP
jgi:hypothetical protein